MEHLLLLSCIESRIENNRSFYGRFQLGPFQIGQGITVANTLRRALLSEVSGIAITSVKINGVTHEYSTIKGVRESVLTILLNLKQIVLISNFQFTESQIGYLYVRGPAIVKAKNLKLPLGIQCVDPEQYIAKLSNDGILKLKFVISLGQNYINQTPLEINEAFFKKKMPLLQNSNKDASTSQSTIEDKREFDSNQILDFDSNQILSHDEEKIFFNNNSFIIKIKNKLPSKILIYEQKINLKEAYSKHIIDSKLPNESNMFIYDGSIKNKKSEKNQDSPQSLISQKNYSLGTIKDGKRTLFESKPKMSFQLKKPEFVFLKNDLKKSVSSTILSQQEKNTNILPIDAVFMPVNKVNFMIETDNEGEKTTERIILEIWTNGSLHPRQAIHEAAKSIIRLFFPFQETKLLKSIGRTSSKILQKKLPEIQDSNKRLTPSSSFASFAFTPASALKHERVKVAKAKVMGEEKLNFKTKKENIALEKKRYSIDIGNLDLSLRPYTCLKRANINTIGDLVQYSADELLLLKNFGKRSLEEVEKNLAQMGLTLNIKTS